MVLGLTWDPDFVRTKSGMIMITESAVGLLGGVVGFVLANGLESFLYWSSFVISGIFVFTHVTNLTPSLESKLPALAKIVSSSVCSS